MGKGISLTGIKSPCKDCKKRTPKCHSHCLNYKKFYEENEEFKKCRQEYGKESWESRKTFQKLSTEITWKKRV